jgi:hypothetical protein
MTDEPFWRVRRIQSPSGVTLKHPVFWGSVQASAASVAVKKFLQMSRAHENERHFDAIQR